MRIHATSDDPMALANALIATMTVARTSDADFSFGPISSRIRTEGLTIEGEDLTAVERALASIEGLTVTRDGQDT